MLGEVVSVVEYKNSISIGLKNGQIVSAGWSGPEAYKTINEIFKGLKAALEEYLK